MAKKKEEAGLDAGLLAHDALLADLLGILKGERDVVGAHALIRARLEREPFLASAEAPAELPDAAELRRELLPPKPQRASMAPDSGGEPGCEAVVNAAAEGADAVVPPTETTATASETEPEPS